MGLFSLLSDLVSDTYTDRNGYKRYKDSNKLVHRYAAEKRIGRKLRKGEVVHHINRDKSDNSKKNLWVFKNQDAHDRAHRIDAMRHGKKASYKGFKKSNWLLDLFK